MNQLRRTSTFARRRSNVIRRKRPSLTWEQLEDHIDNDPLFRIFTADNRYWIDPFTGKRSAAVQHHAQAVRGFFQQYNHWQKYPIKSMQELQFWRWVHYLTEHIRNEPRLRFFRQDGSWLEPYGGQWSDGVRRVDGRITSMTLHEMAKVLAVAVDPFGQPAMKSFDDLRTIIEQGNAGPRAAANANPFAAADKAAEGSEAAAAEDGSDGTGMVAKDEPAAEAAAAAVESSASGNPVVSDDALADQVLAQAPAPEPEAPAEEAEVKLDDSSSRPRVPGPTTERARRVQSRLLGELPDIDGLELAVRYVPAEQVSGDFYDAIPLDDHRTLLAIGDVTGHGVQAALTMATVLKALRFICRDSDDLVDIAARLNEEVHGDMLPEQFVTCFFGIIDTSDSSLTCLLAGHHPTVVANPNHEDLLKIIGNRGAAIGVTKGPTVRATYKPVRIDLSPGDVIIQYTDGLSEAMTPDGEEFGDLRLYGSVVAHLDHQLDDLLDGLLGLVQGWSQREDAEDDLTVLAIRVKDEDD